MMEGEDQKTIQITGGEGKEEKRKRDKKKNR